MIMNCELRCEGQVEEMEYEGVSKRKRGREMECNRFNTAEGCSYGDACRFKHVPLPPDKTSVTDSLTGPRKACTKFFSTSGCPYGEGCHFSHYVPGGIPSVTPGSLVNGTPGSNMRKIHGRISSMDMPFNASTSSEPGSVLVGSKPLCNKFGTREGCRFGDKCHFVHGAKELKDSHGSFQSSERDSHASLDILKDRAADVSMETFGNMIRPGGLVHHEFNHSIKDTLASFGTSSISNILKDRATDLSIETFGHMIRTGGLAHHEFNHSSKDAVASFGACSITSINIDAALARSIIGKNGKNIKQICRLTGAELSIHDHESDSNFRNIEIQGSLEQVQQASEMVHELIFHMGPPPSKSTGFGAQNYKTKLCANYAQGKCTFAERCHFAHGASEMQDHSFRA